MFKILSNFLGKPELYAPSSAPFWDDEYISKNMLQAHLDPNTDAASRKPEFLDRSASWITKIAPPAQYQSLLDLGCGPGLYTERFSAAGYSVTGVDFSKRSIAYAKEQTLLHDTNIDYHYQDYLTIDYTEQFDVITLIYLDYAVLSDTQRLTLLRRVYQALKPNGKFIFDVSTPVMKRGELCSWKYHENGGFFSESPHICLESIRQYDEARAKLSQYIVITEDGVECYNIWDRFFTKEELLSEVQTVGFTAVEFYGDVAGKHFSDTGETICCVATK